MKEEMSRKNPYPGLRPFQFLESELFFGRERQSKELLRKLRRNRFLAVVGTSGSGKSSLVRAGLLPLLDRGPAVESGEVWRVALFRPGKSPISNLALALNSPNSFTRPHESGDGDGPPRAGADEGDQLRAAVIETTLRRSAVGLADHARRPDGGPPYNLLVCVDQFEELFRFKEQSQKSNPKDEAAAFVKLLLEAAHDKGVAVYVLLTMRSDFLGECSQFRGLPEAINEGQYLIPRMSRDEQREAITGPAARRGASMTPRLVNRLLNDVGDNPDQLPLLQHALMRTWDEWKKMDEGHRAVHAGDAINLCCYGEVGGMSEALSRHADQTFEALPEKGRSRRIAEKLFKALTETVTNRREVRRPVTVGEVGEIAEADPADVIEVVKHFREPGRSFLMPPPPTRLTDEVAEAELTSETVVDISHESVIREWNRLKEWVDEEAKSSAMYERIADAARRRYSNEEGGASLLRDPELKFAREMRVRQRWNEAWARRYDPRFKEAMAFLRESKLRRKREQREEEAREREEREREERERRLKLDITEAELANQRSLTEAERRRAEEAVRREEAERERTEEAHLRAAAEHARAEEAKRREKAEHDRAEEAKRVALAEMARAEAESARAEAESARAEVQQQTAVKLEAAARRLKYLAAALAAILLLAAGVAVYALSEKLRADSNATVAETNATLLSVELDNSRKLTDETEAAKNRAVAEGVRADAEAQSAKRAQEEAEKQRGIVQKKNTELRGKYKELQTTLNNLDVAEKKGELAKKLEDAQRNGPIELENGDAQRALENFQFLQQHYQNSVDSNDRIAWLWADYNLGNTFRKMRRYDLASDNYKAALVVQKLVPTEQSLQAVTMLRLGQMHGEQGNYKEADDVYNLLSALLNGLGASADNVERKIVVKRERARLYQEQARDYGVGAAQKSEELTAVEKRLAGLQGRPDAKPDELREVAARAARLRGELDELKAAAADKFAATEVLYKEVVDERENGLTEIHPDLINSYNALAAFYQDEAQAYEEGALPAPPGGFLDEAAEAARARANGLYRMAHAARYIRPGAYSIDSTDDVKAAQAEKLEALGDIYSRHERYAAAGKFINAALPVRSELAGKELNPGEPDGRVYAGRANLALASTLARLAVVRYKGNRDADAEAAYEQLLKVLDGLAEHLGADIVSVDSGGHTHDLVLLLGDKAKYAEAEAVLERLGAVSGKAVRNIKDAGEKADAASGVVTLLTELGRFRHMQGPERLEAAERALQDAIGFVREVYGPESEMDYEASLLSAVYYWKAGRYDEALPLFQRVRGIFERKIGPQQRANWRPGSSELTIRVTGYSWLEPGAIDYLEALRGLADLHARRREKQESEATYQEWVAAAEWASLNFQNLYSFADGDEKELEKRERYQKEYVEALEAYATFLEGENRALEAKPLRERAAQLRIRLRQGKTFPIRPER